MAKRKFILAVVLVGFLGACGEPAPAVFNANLDVDCNPHDPLDKIYAMFSPEGFWREQEYDMGLMMSAGRKNLESSKTILADSIEQRGTYFSRAQQAATERGLSGSAHRAHVKENMDRYEAEVKAIEDRIQWQERSLSWVRQCTRTVTQELRALGLQPKEFDPTKRP